MFVALASVALAAWLSACRGSGEHRTLTIYAAASIGPTVQRAVERYASAVPNLEVVTSTGSSAALRVQIEQGAPADLFLSADVKNAQTLADAGIAESPLIPFARTVLTIIVRPGNPLGIRIVADLAKPGVRVAAAAEGVPVTSYVAQLLEAQAGRGGNPPDLVARIASNVISEEEDVQAVASRVRLGEADAAIVYEVVSFGARDLETIAIPDDENVEAVYAAAVIAKSSQRDGARAFLAWLTGPDGSALLTDSGLRLPRPSQ